MRARIFRIQNQLSTGVWKNVVVNSYHSPYEAEKDARVRCAYWRVVTGSGKVVIQGPQR